MAPFVPFCERETIPRPPPLCPVSVRADGGDCSLRSTPDLASQMPRNVVLLMADGVGPRHWDAARITKGQPLAVDRLAGPVLYATDSLDRGIPTDSAASASAMATGRCVHNGELSVSPEGFEATTVLELAQQAGKRTGVLTNTLMVDASPMAFTTHVFQRTCLGPIVRQTLGTGPDVWMGGGFPVTEGVDIEAEARAAGYQVITRMPDDHAGLPAGTPLLGVFGAGPSSAFWPDWQWGLTPVALREPDSDEPTLAELTSLALERLGDGEGGFFLFVEDEHPDTIGHAAINDPTLAALLIAPAVLELDAAIEVVLEWVAAHSTFEETLVVVASDHENGGYSFQGDTPAALAAASFVASPAHTSLPVPAYARGPGSAQLQKVNHVSDLYFLLTGQVASMPSASGCPP